MPRKGLILALVLAAGAALGGCSAVDLNGDGRSDVTGRSTDTLFGRGEELFGGGSGRPGRPAAVNAFLWRASLEAISFMPLASADPLAGVIITDWYSPPESPGERFKITVYVMDRALRADGVKVAVFKQRRDGEGNWVDVAVDPKTVNTVESKILERARQLRMASVTKKE